MYVISHALIVQVTWFNVTIGRHVYSSDEAQAGRMSVFRPRQWDRLPTEIRCVSNTEQFKRHLKMFLFKSAFTDC